VRAIDSSTWPGENGLPCTIDFSTTTPLAGDPKKMQFFFSTPWDVLARCVKDLAGGEIWRHLAITLTEALLAFVIGAGAGVVIGFWFARQALLAAVFDP